MGTVAGEIGRSGFALHSRRGTFQVDASHADIRGAGRHKLGRASRVLVWGTRVGENALRATCIQVLASDNTRQAKPAARRPSAPSLSARHSPDWSDRILTGWVTGQKSSLFRHALTIASDGVEWRVELPRGVRVTRGGRPLPLSDIAVGQYVRIEGRPLQRCKFRASRIAVDALAVPTPGMDPEAS